MAPININKLKLCELKQELIKRGLSRNGTKKVLVSRLRGALDSTVIEIEDSLLQSVGPNQPESSGDVIKLESNKPNINKLTRNNTTIRKLTQEIQTLKHKISRFEVTLKSLIKANKKLTNDVKELKTRSNAFGNGSADAVSNSSHQNQQATREFNVTNTNSIHSQSHQRPQSVPNDEPLNNALPNKTPPDTSKYPKILILSDSHGRDLSTILTAELKSYSVTNICKPGATLETVVENLYSQTEDFSFQDHVIIIGGSNNSSDGKVSQAVLKRILFTAKYTNVLLSAAPYQFSEKNKNTFLYKINKLFYNAVTNFYKSQRCSSINFVDVNDVLVRDNYVKSGKHLNYNGKLKISQLFERYILGTENCYSYKQIISVVPLKYQNYQTNNNLITLNTSCDGDDPNVSTCSYATGESACEGISASDNFLVIPQK